jgi:hypothetical protein
MTPEEALNRLWEIAHTLDELSDLHSIAFEGDGGIACALRLLYKQAEDCAVSLHPVVIPPAPAECSRQ